MNQFDGLCNPDYLHKNCYKKWLKWLNIKPIPYKEYRVNDAISSKGFTLLMKFASLTKRFPEVENVLVNYLENNKNEINELTEDGISVIDIAINNIDNLCTEITIRNLLKFTSNINTITGGKNALGFACVIGNKNIVNLLIELKADVNSRCELLNIDFPIVTSFVRKHFEITKILLENNANPNVVTITGSMSPLMLAVINNSKEYLDLLLEHKADCNIQHIYGQTPLLLAANYCIKDTVESLLKAGADPNIKFFKNISALGIIVNQNISRTDIADLLLRYNADPNHMDGGVLLLVNESSRQNNIEMVKLLVKFKADCNIEDENCMTSIVMSVISNNYTITKFLLENGNISKINKVGTFFVSLIYENEKLLELFLKAGISPNIPFDSNLMISFPSVIAGKYNGRTPLAMSIDIGNHRIANMLIKYGAYLNIEDSTESLPFSIDKGYNDIVIILLKNGFDVNKKYTDNKTALFIAVEKKNTEVIRILLSFGADVNVRDINGHHLLNHAAIYDNEENFRLLLGAGAEPEVKDILSKNTPLMYASITGCENIVKLLLQNRVDPNVINRLKQNTLILACKNRNINIVKMLINVKSNLDQQDKNGESALFRPSCDGNVEMVKILLDAGINPNIQNKDGISTLQFAASYGHYETVKMLLDYNADPNNIDKKFITPLMIAAENGFVDIVKLLIDNGADTNLQDLVHKNTALMNAVIHEHEEIVYLLIKAATNISLCNLKGKTALMLAKEKFNVKIIKLLKTKKKIVPLTYY